MSGGSGSDDPTGTDEERSPSSEGNTGSAASGEGADGSRPAGAAPDGGFPAGGEHAVGPGVPGRSDPDTDEGPADGEATADEHRTGAEATYSRREALGYATGVGAGLGGWKALDNVVLGYGVLMGTNLVEQDLAGLVSEDLAARETAIPLGGYELRTDGETLAIADSGAAVASLDVAAADPADAAAIEADLGLAGSPLVDLLADLRALAAGDVRFEFSAVDPFVDRVRTGDARPLTVAALRGPTFERPEPAFVREFAGADPADVRALVPGIAAGFREHTYYDVPRYAAGSIEDNVLLGAVDLRQHFESPTDFEAVVSGENSGLFCTELVGRSIEAFHAVPATEQSPPVAAGFVSDQRHKHAYTVLASAVREDGDLVVPVTFVDYTHSTLYHDLHLTWLLGEGIEAYDSRHRATYVRWNRYPRI